jgi:hypothetical protein
MLENVSSDETPKPFAQSLMAFLPLFTGYGAACPRPDCPRRGVSRPGPGGRLAQLVRALP